MVGCEIKFQLRCQNVGLFHPMSDPLLLDDLDRRILNAMQADSSMTNAELARRCSVTPQTMHAIGVGLESAGLIVRQAHLTQPRLLQLYLSNAGEQIAGEGRVLVSGVEARMLMLLSHAERDQFGDLIHRCLATLGR